MTYEKKAKKILASIENAKVALSFHEIDRRHLERAIATELRRIEAEEAEELGDSGHNYI